MIIEEKRLYKKALIHIIAMVVSVICVLPLIVTLLHSFFPFGSLSQVSKDGFTFDQYSEILLLAPEFFGWFWNSFRSTFLILLFNIPISLMAGFAFSQYKLRWLKWVFMLYIILMLMPFQATMVPQYITLKSLDLLNSPWAIIIPNIFATFGAFLISQSMKSIPKEIFEAGRLDGLSEFKLFTKIAVPVSTPTTVALIILIFIDNWSMVEQPTIFLQKVHLFPLSITLTTSVFPTVVFAGSIIFSILPLLIYLKGYDKLVNGITLGAIK